MTDELRPGERFATIVDVLSNYPDVTFGAQGKKRFGTSALKIHDKIFAMLDSRGQFVVKLPHDRVTRLIDAGHGVHFEAGRGRPMREWFSVDPESTLDWLTLAKEAMAFVGAER
jgi:hypothetical protein